MTHAEQPNIEPEYRGRSSASEGHGVVTSTGTDHTDERNPAGRGMRPLDDERNPAGRGMMNPAGRGMRPLDDETVKRRKDIRTVIKATRKQHRGMILSNRLIVFHISNSVCENPILPQYA